MSSAKDNFIEVNTDVDQQDVITLLNEEISQIQKEQTKPGWTVWALIGGIATCFWLLISEIQSLNTSWNIVYTLLISISIVFFTLRSGINFIGVRLSSKSQNRLTSTREIFSGSVTTLVLAAVWFAVLVYFVKTQPITSWHKTLTYVCLSFMIFSGVFSLIFSENKSYVLPRGLLELSMPKTKIYKIIIIIATGFVLLNIFTSYLWVNHIITTKAFSIHEFKISILVCGIIGLLLLTTALKDPPQSLNNLLELRRDLLLGVLSIEEVKSQLDLIFHGLKIDDYYSSESSQILGSIQLFKKELYLATQKISLYEKVASNNYEDRTLTQDALYESILNHFILAAKIMFDQIQTKHNRLIKKIKWLYIFVDKNSKSEILNEVTHTINLTMNEYNALVKKWYNLLKECKDAVFATAMINQLHSQVPLLHFDNSTGEVDPYFASKS